MTISQLTHYIPDTQHLIAYFCMEFALAEDFHLYSGGLGILAGDLLYEANSQRLPLIGVTLLYSHSYAQVLDAQGRQIEQSLALDPQNLGVQPIESDTHERLTVSVSLLDREVLVSAWVKIVGSTPLILLDTNLPENQESDRQITDQLYSGDKEHRLLQEIILGIGGAKMVRALHLDIQTYHMNEGHAAFLSWELIMQQLESTGATFEEAKVAAQKHLVFSNHTLISAGNDAFSFETVIAYLDHYARQHGVNISHLLDLGKLQDTSVFSMTMLGLRMARTTNAVSHYHAHCAKQLWKEHPMVPITNGIFLPRWLSEAKKDTWPLHENSAVEPQAWWEAHQTDKQHLLQYVQDTTGKKLEINTLIFTWARRFVDYKRPRALFWQLDWLETIIRTSKVPLHFIFAGKVHPHDEAGKQSIAEVVQISQSDRFKPYLTYLPNYNLEVAEKLVQGSDVWLNTPLEGYEACGTSGMKAALNGVLQCTTNDGWVREVNWENLGWVLDNEHISESLYRTIESQIIPLYTETQGSEFPPRWVARMIDSSTLIRAKYSSQRMLDEYQSLLYTV